MACGSDNLSALARANRPLPRAAHPEPRGHGPNGRIAIRPPLPDATDVVKGRSIVAARLTPAAYSNGLALALPQVVMARPEGFGRALATYELPIEGRDEWLAAARRLA